MTLVLPDNLLLAGLVTKKVVVEEVGVIVAKHCSYISALLHPNKGATNRWIFVTVWAKIDLHNRP